MIFDIKTPGKKIRETCERLGSPYCIKPFDLENVIYRDLKNGYDIEVSGLDNQKRTFNATIYVWQTEPSNHIVETISNIDSFDVLSNTLDEIINRYHA